MNINELKDFIIQNVPNFKNPEILSEGECFHYTPFWSKIFESNKIKGAKIDNDLDRTQNLNRPREAKEDIGVVFAYEELSDSRMEGDGRDIIKIHYRAAVRAMHGQENDFGAVIADIAKQNGIEMETLPTPHTLLILTTDIVSFEYFEKAKYNW